MKKAFLSLAAAAFITVAIIGCKGGTGSDPKATAAAFMDAMKNKDWDGAEKLGTKDTKTFLETLKSMMSMAESMGKKNDDMSFDKDWKGKTVTYSDAKIDGDNATVTMLADGKEQMPISLKKEDGSWKVAFDKATLMKQATDKMGDIKNSGEMQSADSTLQNMDIKGMQDSVTKAMGNVNKAMGDVNKTLDSVKKAEGIK